MEIGFQRSSRSRCLLNQAVGLAGQFGLDLVGALVLLIAGWIVAGWTRRGVRRVVDRVPHLDETLKPVIASVARYGNRR